MSRWNESGWVSWMAMAVSVAAAAGSLSLAACQGRLPAEEKSERAAPPAAATPSVAAAPAAVPVSAPPARPESQAKAKVETRSSPVMASSSVTSARDSTLVVKRFVVTTAVQDREPIAGSEALPSDGQPIYAFAELQNPGAEPENVRVTFERKGGTERVGNVTLPVPAKVSRHRTWANTRFIRSAGVWEAVLWSEAGKELGRASFEVADS